MRSVAETFEAVFQVLERGEAVGIFPEGITYDDSALKEVKSGAARMALELEHRHGGKLGLRVVPVGSDVFGEGDLSERCAGEFWRADPGGGFRAGLCRAAQGMHCRG